VRPLGPLIALTLFGSAFQVSKLLDGLPLDWDRKQALAVWSGETLSRMFAGYENAMADIYWLRSIQYHGGEIAFNPESKLDLLETYLEVTTTLDPRFEIAYRYGAVFLSEGRYGANTPLAGIRLLEKGLKHMPNNWRLAQDRAMFTSFYLKDPVLAARRCEEASRMPGAPAHLKVLAATFLAEGNSRAAARAIWQELTGPSEEPFVRASAQRYLDRYNAIELAEKLTELVPLCRERLGRNPASADDFVAASILRRLPVDPSGVPFVFDAASQRFRVSRASTLYLEGL
jgi:hypothetical protein